MKEKIELTLKEAEEICAILGKIKLELEQAPPVIKIVEFIRNRFQDEPLEEKK